MKNGKLFEHDHERVIEIVEAISHAETHRMASAARRSIGQILRRDREKRPHKI
jgi:hypothetical protein